jgi:LmbE family N-acetylglucosaminyl deacetylase
MKDITSILKQDKRKVMLVVFPHPDDETVMVGGLMQRAKALGWDVTIACLTQGERGQIHIRGRGRSLGAIRQDELQKATKHLGEISVRQFDFPDGHLNHCQWWQKTVGELIRATRPSLIVTYDHSGATGHPDHIALSLEIFDYLKKITKTRLLWVSFSDDVRKKFVPEGLWAVTQKPEYILSLTFKETIGKSLGILAHASQGLWKHASLWGWFWWYRTECYSEANLTGKYPHKYIEFRI